MRSEQILGVLVLALGLVACSDNDNADKTLTPSATNLSGPTATAPPALTATATSVAPRHILLDTAPRPQPTAVTRTIGGQPPSLFPAWDGKSTVIYDTVTATTRDLGPGTQPASFSPDGTKAAWAAGEGFAAGMEVFVVDLPSGAPRSLGPGRTAQFIDDVSIVVFSVGGNDRIMVDVASGMRRPYAGESIPPTLLAREPALPEGLSVEPWNPGDTQVRTYTVRDVSSNAVLLTFDAAAVAAAGKNELAVAAPPAEGRSNVYVINVRTGEATYLASAAGHSQLAVFGDRRRSPMDRWLLCSAAGTNHPVRPEERRTGPIRHQRQPWHGPVDVADAGRAARGWQLRGDGPH